MRTRKTLLDDTERIAAAERVFATVKSMAAFIMAENVLLYHSLPDELSTREFLECLPAGKHYYLPRVNGPDLDILPYEKSKLHLGSFQIEEPDGDDTVDINDIDLIIVPAVAYDRQGNRLGRGKGFYDRLLARSNAITIGVCYGFQLVDSIDTDGHDIPVDYVVADQAGIIRGRFRKQHRQAIKKNF